MPGISTTTALFANDSYLRAIPSNPSQSLANRCFATVSTIVCFHHRHSRAVAAKIITKFVSLLHAREGRVSYPRYQRDASVSAVQSSLSVQNQASCECFEPNPELSSMQTRDCTLIRDYDAAVSLEPSTPTSTSSSQQSRQSLHAVALPNVTFNSDSLNHYPQHISIPDNKSGKSHSGILAPRIPASNTFTLLQGVIESPDAASESAKRHNTQITSTITTEILKTVDVMFLTVPSETSSSLPQRHSHNQSVPHQPVPQQLAPEHQPVLDDPFNKHQHTRRTHIPVVTPTPCNSTILSSACDGEGLDTGHKLHTAANDLRADIEFVRYTYDAEFSSFGSRERAAPLYSVNSPSLQLPLPQSVINCTEDDEDVALGHARTDALSEEDGAVTIAGKHILQHVHAYLSPLTSHSMYGKTYGLLKYTNHQEPDNVTRIASLPCFSSTSSISSVSSFPVLGRSGNDSSLPPHNRTTALDAYLRMKPIREIAGTPDYSQFRSVGKRACFELTVFDSLPDAVDVVEITNTDDLFSESSNISEMPILRRTCPQKPLNCAGNIPSSHHHSLEPTEDPLKIDKTDSFSEHILPADLTDRLDFLSYANND